jgi:hypothetical protein
MESPALSNFTNQAAATLAVSRSGAHGNAARFADLLPKDGATGRRAVSTEDQARKAAEQFVAGTLVLPILREARENPFKTEMFHGGATEDAFGQQLDTILADRITASANLGIVDSVYRSLTKNLRKPAVGSEVNLNG